MATVTYYFNDYVVPPAHTWTDPENMVDGSITTFANATSNWDQTNNENTCDGTDLGTISKVELRFHGYISATHPGGILSLQPYFLAGPGDEDHTEALGTSGAYSSYFDITTDTNAPSPWTWSDVNTGMDIFVLSGDAPRTFYCSIVEIQVTYTPVVAVAKIPRHSGAVGMPHIFGVFPLPRKPIYRCKPRLHHVA